MAYDWKNKISNTGLMRFCSKTHTTQEERMNEGSVPESKRLEHKGASVPQTAVSVKDNKIVETETDLPLVTDSKEPVTLTQESKIASSPSLKEAKLPSSGSSTKRTSSSAVLISPKKRQASAGLKSKLSTPNNQRMISDFFKK